MAWYLQQSLDVAHLPMDNVIKVFKDGFSGVELTINSKDARSLQLDDAITELTREVVFGKTRTRGHVTRLWLSKCLSDNQQRSSLNLRHKSLAVQAGTWRPGDASGSSI